MRNWTKELPKLTKNSPIMHKSVRCLSSFTKSSNTHKVPFKPITSSQGQLTPSWCHLPFTSINYHRLGSARCHEWWHAVKKCNADIVLFQTPRAAAQSTGVASSGNKLALLARLWQLDKSATQTLMHKTFSKPYIFISGYLICYAGWDWAECAHSCISITDHITVPQTFPLLIFTQSIQNNGPFLDSFFFHWPLIGCNYSSTKQMSVLRLPWRLDQGIQQCASFAGLHLYW